MYFKIIYAAIIPRITHHLKVFLMAKKSGFFSWFKKDAQEPQQQVENVEQTEVDQALESQDVDVASDTTDAVAIEPVAPAQEALSSDEPSVVADLEVVEQPAATEPTVAVPAQQDNDLDGAIDSVSQPDVESLAEPEVDLPVAEAPKQESMPKQEQEPEPDLSQAIETSQAPETSQAAAPSIGFFERLKRGLSKTRQQIGGGFLSLFKGKEIDDELYEELETQLLMADVGMDTTVKLIDRLTEHADRKQLKDADALYGLLKSEMSEILKKSDAPLTIENQQGPFVILMVGVNGVGKTTTIGKMAKQFQQQGKSVMLAAGDTFRAAAVEQLQVWGERNSVPVIAQHTGADSASVIFDAYQAAKARNADVLIADTAGRLQNKDNLMQELEKIVRVLKKFDAAIPHEIMLTIDATTGQNAISQTKIFNEAVGLTGISLTKLDGTAKGGVIFAVAEQFEIPIRYIGVGEGIEDLRTFEHQSFIDALFDGTE